MWKIILKLNIGILLLTFTGIKYDREWNEPSFFIKHRPTFTFEYYSITGESDVTIEDLKDDETKKIEQQYIEFVDKQKDNFLDQFAFLIIPLFLVLIISSCLQLLTVIPRKKHIKAFVFSYCSSLFLLFFTYWNFFNVGGNILNLCFFILTTASIFYMYRNVTL